MPIWLHLLQNQMLHVRDVTRIERRKELLWYNKCYFKVYLQLTAKVCHHQWHYHFILLLSAKQVKQCCQIINVKSIPAAKNDRFEKHLVRTVPLPVWSEGCILFAQTIHHVLHHGTWTTQAQETLTQACNISFFSFISKGLICLFLVASEWVCGRVYM